MFLLSPYPLNAPIAIDAVLTDSDGAYVLFVGVTRNNARGRNVTGLEYDAYRPLAEKEMAKIVFQVCLYHLFSSGLFNKLRRDN